MPLPVIGNPARHPADRRNSRKNQILLRRNEPPECKRKDADVDPHPATNRNHNRFNPIGLQETAFNGITKNMQRMQLIFKYVIEYYKEKITLSDAANVISMSTTAFCSFFKRETGKTFTNFINEYRIEAVGTLLRNFPDKDINEIAWQCGFTDIPYFNRFSKR